MNKELQKKVADYLGVPFTFRYGMRNDKNEKLLSIDAFGTGVDFRFYGEPDFELILSGLKVLKADAEHKASKSA